jgi:hypothetical protein
VHSLFENPKDWLFTSERIRTLSCYRNVCEDRIDNRMKPLEMPYWRCHSLCTCSKSCLMPLRTWTHQEIGRIFDYAAVCISDCIRNGRWGAHERNLLLLCFYCDLKDTTSPDLLPGSIATGFAILVPSSFRFLALGGYSGFQ